jgi:3-oxoacyl-ACP reductase-like protein
MMKQRRTTTETPAAAKAPARPAAARTPAKSRHTADAVARPAAIPLDASERQRLVAMAAYFRAEKRGFIAGGEIDDWLEAEKDVARQLGG